MRSSTRYAALRYSPAQPVYRRRAARRLTVLCYHGVDDAARFSQHLAHLARNFAPVSLADVEAAVLDGRPLPRGALLITFDDGERSVLEIAGPMMRRRGIPGVAFVIGGLLDTDRPFWWREAEHLARAGGTTRVAGGPPGELVQALKRVPNARRLAALDDLRATAATPAPPMPQLRREELPELEALGITVASHTQTHPCLDRCDDEEIERELAQCRATVSEALGRDDHVLAYPNGDWDERVLAAARRTGFRLGFQLGGRAVGLGPGAPPLEPLALHRVTVDSTAGVDRVAVLASGLLPSALRGRDRLRALRSGGRAAPAGARR